MKQIAQLLQEMAEAAREENPPRSHSKQRADSRSTNEIRHKNSNRAILINGKRGSGKTTVMVTLLDLLSNLEENQPSNLPLFGVDAMPRVVATDIIDMQPLPENTHLMMHLASALYRLGAAHTRKLSSDCEQEQLDDCWERLAQSLGKA